jgi:immunity protein 52 of polymorphic toxin system
MPPPIDELQEIVKRGQRVKSTTKELSQALGYWIAAWNGLEEPQSLSFLLHVGAYVQRLYPNEIQLEGLRPGNALVDAAILKRVLLTLAECWDADWAVVETWQYEGLTVDANEKPLLPYGGWLTYLSRELAEKVSPPRDVHSEQTPNGGLFILVSEEAFDAENQIHIARLDAVQKSLAPVQRPLSAAF